MRLLGATEEQIEKGSWLHGINRRVDVLAEGIAHESKVGYLSYSRSALRQIIKDVKLRKTAQISNAHWHFFRSAITGEVGADPRLLRVLDHFGIRYTIHRF